MLTLDNTLSLLTPFTSCHHYYKACRGAWYWHPNLAVMACEEAVHSPSYTPSYTTMMWVFTFFIKPVFHEAKFFVQTESNPITFVFCLFMWNKTPSGKVVSEIVSYNSWVYHYQCTRSKFTCINMTNHITGISRFIYTTM